jgi:hypothetical protein
MTRYRVAFDGKWQGAFKEREDALGWAEDVGETGRLVYVIQRRWWRWPRLGRDVPRKRS